jgi:light-harvesting complex I chlorophyll a/b binding protein 1
MRSAMYLHAEETVESMDPADKVQEISQTVESMDPADKAQEMTEEEAKSTTLNAAVAAFNPKTQVGSCAPIDFFDPLDMSKEVDENTFKIWQEAETKHGRIAMLAFVGIVAGEALEGSAPFFNSEITGPAIFQFQQADAIFPAFWLGVLQLIAWVEGGTIINNWQPLDDTFKDPNGRAFLAKNIVPGDLGWDPLNLKPKDEAKYAIMKTKELNNGRLAMLGVTGIVAQEVATGNSIF